MRIIGFTGPKGSGKDTAASVLFKTNEAEGITIYRKSGFADGVKNICEDFFGWTREEQDDETFKETPRPGWSSNDPEVDLEPRWAMMDIANWLRDKYGGGVHVRRWLRHATAYEARVHQELAHVITDLRFPEELEMLLEHDALIIYVARTSKEEELAAKQAAGDAMALNPSEAFYAGIKAHPNTIVIPNDGDIYQLHNEVRAAVKNKYGHPLHWERTK